MSVALGRRGGGWRLGMSFLFEGLEGDGGCE